MFCKGTTAQRTFPSCLGAKVWKLRSRKHRIVFSPSSSGPNWASTGFESSLTENTAFLIWDANPGQPLDSEYKYRYICVNKIWHNHSWQEKHSFNMFYGEDAGSHPEYHKSNSNQSFPTPSVTNTLVTTHTDLVTPSSFLISSYISLCFQVQNSFQKGL